MRYDIASGWWMAPHAMRELVARAEKAEAQVQRLRNARHGTGLYPWHCPACEELHRALGGGGDE